MITGSVVHVLDLAAKLDSTAEFVCKEHWGNIEFPPPFGREALPEVGDWVQSGFWMVLTRLYYKLLVNVVTV